MTKSQATATKQCVHCASRGQQPAGVAPDGAPVFLCMTCGRLHDGVFEIVPGAILTELGLCEDCGQPATHEFLYGPGGGEPSPLCDSCER